MSTLQNAAKMDALRAAMNQLEKKYGRGTIMTLGSAASINVEAMSSGSLALNRALGINGLPRGRVIEIYGPESSGKTSLALQALAQAQRAGGVGAFIDAEHALDPGWARKLGVNVEDLVLSQPDNGEAALEITEILVRSGAVDVIVVDSVAALVPRAEIEGEMGDSHVGLHARLLSQALRKLTAAIANSKCMVIFINQIRMKIGVMYGSPETTTGGNALKFYASVRLDVRRAEAIKEGDQMIGHVMKVKVVKNKVAAPFKQAMVPVFYDRGFCPATEALSLGVEAGIFEKSGSWFSLDGQKIGQGQAKAVEWLREHPEVVDRVVQQLSASPAEAVPLEERDAGDAGDAEEPGDLSVH
ncbi:recombinase RecA [Sinimarinibacterium sp. CAU 1509]|nr:recombinase RecA [Sinimarinibacterium sp. CAU 1509]